MSKLYSFPLRQPSTTYGIGNTASGLTLIDHILSANPHPNQTTAGGGSGSAGELEDRYNQHIANRTQSATGEVTDSPHKDQNGDQLFAGYKHHHDSSYASITHNHDDRYAKLVHTHDNYITQDQLYAALGKNTGEAADVVMPTPVTSYHGETEKVKESVIDYNAIIKNGTYLIAPYQYYYYPNESDTTAVLTTIAINNGPTTTGYPHELRMVYGRSRDASAVKYLGRQTVTTGDGHLYIRTGTAGLSQGVTSEQLSITVNLSLRVNGIPSGVMMIDEQRTSLAGIYVYNATTQCYRRLNYPIIDTESGAVLRYEPFPDQLSILETLPDGTTLYHPYLQLSSVATDANNCILQLLNGETPWLTSDSPVAVPAFNSAQDYVLKMEAYATYFADSPLVNFTYGDQSIPLTITAETTRTYEYSVESFTYGNWVQLQ